MALPSHSSIGPRPHSFSSHGYEILSDVAQGGIVLLGAAIFITVMIVRVIKRAKANVTYAIQNRHFIPTPPAVYPQADFHVRMYNEEMYCRRFRRTKEIAA